nr:hypothetical protein BaRGS_022591 [Batillaria attramentaria]KAG5709074.1 hypothetical protein BaRGS_004713 [Batillaria attramentaria]
MNRWGSLVMGQVVRRGVKRPDTVRVRCLRLKLDDWLMKVIVRVEFNSMQAGEVSAKRTSPLISHEIKEHVFKLGSVVDPVTGKRCRGKVFIDEELRELEAEMIQKEREAKTTSS